MKEGSQQHNESMVCSGKCKELAVALMKGMQGWRSHTHNHKHTHTHTKGGRKVGRQESGRSHIIFVGREEPLFKDQIFKLEHDHNCQSAVAEAGDCRYFHRSEVAEV